MVTHWENVDKDDTDDNDDCGRLVEDFGLVVGACDNEAFEEAGNDRLEEVGNDRLEGGINSVI